MSELAVSKILRGLEEAKAYMEGEREGFKVTPRAESESPRKLTSLVVLEAPQPTVAVEQNPLKRKA